jgi:hypothetical protein
VEFPSEDIVHFELPRDLLSYIQTASAPRVQVYFLKYQEVGPLARQKPGDFGQAHSAIDVPTDDAHNIRRPKFASTGCEVSD